MRESWARAHRGSYDWNVQTGHPLGVPDFAYVGEVALGVVLADPTRELTELKAAITYPDALTTALATNLWEAQFLVTIAGKATGRADAAYVALCLTRALLICAHALYGHDQRWLVNEKGAIAGAGRLPSAPTDFGPRCQELLGRLGTTERDLEASAAEAEAVVEEVIRVCRAAG